MLVLNIAVKDSCADVADKVTNTPGGTCDINGDGATDLVSFNNNETLVIAGIGITPVP